MILGIFAKTFGLTAAGPSLQAAAHAGYACVQFNMQCAGLAAMPDAIPKGVGEEISSSARAANVSIEAISGTYNMAHPDPEVARRGLDRLRVLAGACQSIGTNLITLCTGTRDREDLWQFHHDNHTSEAWRDLLGEMEKAVDIAEKYNVRLGVEPELANVVSSAQAAKRLLSDLRSDRVWIVFDPANLFDAVSSTEQHATVSDALDLLGDRIAVAHAKDRRSDGAFTRAGNGILDYRHYIAGLRAIGFGGPLIAHGLSPNEAPRVAEFLSRALNAAPESAGL